MAMLEGVQLAAITPAPAGEYAESRDCRAKSARTGPHRAAWPVRLAFRRRRMQLLDPARSTPDRETLTDAARRANPRGDPQGPHRAGRAAALLAQAGRPARHLPQHRGARLREPDRSKATSRRGRLPACSWRKNRRRSSPPRRPSQASPHEPSPPVTHAGATASIARASALVGVKERRADVRFLPRPAQCRRCFRSRPGAACCRIISRTAAASGLSQYERSGRAVGAAHGDRALPRSAARGIMADPEPHHHHQRPHPGRLQSDRADVPRPTAPAASSRIPATKAQRLRVWWGLWCASSLLVPVDANGLVADELPRTASVTPLHDAVASVSHRAPCCPWRGGTAIIAWARQNGCYIVEDDYDSEFCSRRLPLLPLRRLPRTGLHGSISVRSPSRSGPA